MKPWRRRGRREEVLAAVPEVSPRLKRHAFTLATAPGAVGLARRTTASTLTVFGVTSGTSFKDAALLIVSELVANSVRHAGDRSPTVEITLVIRRGLLVIDVADLDPAVPSLTPETAGDGLLTVMELAAEYGGGVGIVQVPEGGGKAVRVQLVMPDAR